MDSSVRENIILQTSFESGLGAIKADSSQIEQILLNLAVNAQDAMPKGGKLTIQTESTVLDHDFADKHPGTVAGKYLLLSVSDTGHGIDKRHQQHIFEPFYTTKEKGKGTGLGLATVYGIVKQHGGNIWMYSEMGMGTVFKIYFPIIEKKAEDIHAEVEVTGNLRGTETIMITEDDAGVLDFVSNSLKTLGYTVLTSNNAEECMTFFRAAEQNIDLLVTDLVMPGINGRELFEKLQIANPRLKVIFMSGYSADTISSEEVTNGLRIINKPFTLTVLGKEIRRVLAE